MAGPRRPPGRPLTLALLGALGLLLSARAAQAGCHVADPPRSLTDPFERLVGPPALPAPARLDGDGRTTQVAPKPCRDETPARASSASAPAPAANLVIGVPASTSATAGRAHPRSSTPSRADRPRRLDRPPRRLPLD